HLAAFQEILKGEGLEITREDYLHKYIALDDKACFRAVFQDNKRELTEDHLRSLMEKKAESYAKATREGLMVFPGVPEFVMAASQSYPLAVASGALRQEVD